MQAPKAAKASRESAQAYLNLRALKAQGCARSAVTFFGLCCFMQRLLLLQVLILKASNGKVAHFLQVPNGLSTLQKHWLQVVVLTKDPVNKLLNGLMLCSCVSFIADCVQVPTLYYGLNAILAIVNAFAQCRV